MLRGVGGLPLRLARRVLERFGYALVRRAWEPSLSELDIAGDEAFLRLEARCAPYTLTSRERMYALAQAIRYLVRHGMDGAIVECGAWRGGSMMLAALTLLEAGGAGRQLYLYDTFTGMTTPQERDVDYGGKPAPPPETMLDAASLEEVRANLCSTGYPEANLHFVEGTVEDTVPGTAPERIALLRLDTDWYQSTRHELVHLFPRLCVGGVLVVDDYGHWRGSREATDEYLERQGVRMLLHRVDYSCRVGVRLE